MTDVSFWVELFFYLNLNITKKATSSERFVFKNNNVAGLSVIVL